MQLTKTLEVFTSELGQAACVDLDVLAIDEPLDLEYVKRAYPNVYQRIKQIYDGTTPVTDIDYIVIRD